MPPTRRPAPTCPAWLPVAAALAAGLGTALRPAPALAQKSDLIVLRNGDRITGEIKQLSHGLLEYSTDDVGRLKVEWIKLQRIASRMYFEVEVASGWKYFGQLDSTAAEGEVVVNLAPTADTLRIGDVVAITPIGGRLSNRLKAYLDIGFTLAKAQWATTLTGSGEVRYRGPAFGGGISFSSYLQGQENTETAVRHSLQLDGGHYLGARDVLGALVLVERNDELDLKLRVTAGGGFGRTLARTNNREVTAFAGLVVSRERSSLDGGTGAADTTTTSLEGYLRGSLAAFRYDQPKLDFDTDLEAFPSFSDGARVRLNLNIRIKYELFPDFDLGLSFFDAYDSKPAGQEAGKNDFVTSFTVGWSYRR